jgi:uncharacterized protein YndB with AHSA1/START domain
MDIHHGMAVRNTPERLYEALTRQDDLAIWMGASVLAGSGVGSMVEFNFSHGVHIMKMEVIHLEAGSRVHWRQIQPIWKTTSGVSMPGQFVTWTLSTPWESGTLVDFRMGDWLEDDMTYSANSFKWASFLLRLRIYMGDTRDIVGLVPLTNG